MGLNVSKAYVVKDNIMMILHLVLTAFLGGLLLAVYMPLPYRFEVNWAVWAFIVAAIFYGLVMIAVGGRRRLGRYKNATHNGIWDTYLLVGGAVVTILFGYCLVGSVEEQSKLKDMAIFGAATAVGIVAFGFGLCRFIRYFWVLLRRVGEMEL